MTTQYKLTSDQQQYIGNTLSRIREGLNTYSTDINEPSHIFTPERFKNEKI